MRIEIESDNPEVYFRPFNQPMPARIVIINGLQDYWTGFTPGFKRFKNVTIETKLPDIFISDFRDTIPGTWFIKF